MNDNPSPEGGTRSQSSRIYERLQNSAVGFEFTSRELCKMVPGTTIGGVGGFLFKCAEVGMIERLGYRETKPGGRTRLVFRMVDPTVVVPHRVRTTPGSYPGRKYDRDGPVHQPRLASKEISLDDLEKYADAQQEPTLTRPEGLLGPDGPASIEDFIAPGPRRKRKSHPMTPKAMAEALLLLAEEAERMSPGLAGVSTDELLKEVRRRLGDK